MANWEFCLNFYYAVFQWDEHRCDYVVVCWTSPLVPPLNWTYLNICMVCIVLQLLLSCYRCKWQVSIHGQLVDKISENLHISGCVATQYDEIPQRTTKEHYTGPQRIGNTAKDQQRTAKEHNGLSCRKLAPTELNGALYSSARQDFSNAAGLSWEPALSDSQSVRRGRPCYLWTWKFHSSCSHQKLLYADDLAVIAETEEELIERLSEWKENVESKGMGVNMNKTKVMRTSDCEAEGC